MKKPPTKTAKVIWNGTRYAIPLNIIKKYKLSDNENTTTIDTVFNDLITKHGEPGVLLSGLRHKEGLTQNEFAEIIGVTQTNLSAMENGRRTIGKVIAKRIEKKFGVNYQFFL